MKQFMSGDKYLKYLRKKYPQNITVWEYIDIIIKTVKSDI